jgi:hypothetical protein
MAMELIRFRTHYSPGNIMVEYTPAASGANGALISLDGDFRLLGNGYKKEEEEEEEGRLMKQSIAR